jgi:deazaflavin-dependent oxidoreductase (nitroreductase family)
MAEDEVELTFRGVAGLTSEAQSDTPPGSKGWVGEGSQTQRINAAMMAALRANGGTIPGEIGAYPHLILTAKGAKSGKERPVVLWASEIDGRLVVVASLGGAPNNPPWFHNIVANPDVTVEWQGEAFRARAIVLKGEDRDRMFAACVKLLPHFGRYQQRTTRALPVVELARSG